VCCAARTAMAGRRAARPPGSFIAVDTVRALHQALLWRQWSDDVTLFLHPAGAPGAEQRLQPAARGIPVVAGEVVAVEADADGLTGVRLWSGEVVARQAVAVGTRLDARAQFLTDLGLAATGQFLGDEVTGTAVPADATGATSVPGVYVAGNVTNLMAQVIVAAAAGMTTAAAINADLVGEDTRRAGQGFRPSEMLPCPDGCHAPWTVVP
jgi:thioredoxin reductase